MQLFSPLIGNLVAKKTLQQMKERDEVPQTLLFSGPRGVGKTLFALHFAALLMGEAHGSKVLLKNHPDLHFYQVAEKSGMHPISTIHSLIEEIHLSCMQAPLKVFIIDDAERMLSTSSNALLKILEEPPPASFIILVSSEPDHLLGTIVSRCRKVAFFPIPEQEIIDYLKTQKGLIEESASRIAKFSQGSLAKALTLSAQDKNPKLALLQEILRGESRFNPAEEHKKLIQLEELFQEGEDALDETREIDLLLEEIITWQRDRILLSEKADSAYLFHREDLDTLKSTNSKEGSLERLLKAATDCRFALQHNVKLRPALGAVLETLKD